MLTFPLFSTSFLSRYFIIISLKSMENELVLHEVRIFKHVTIARTKNKGALDTNDNFKYSNTSVK